MVPRSEPVTDAGVHSLDAPAHFTICSHRYDPLPTTSLTYTTSDEMLSVLFKHAEK
jgi:hypothetical protein